MNSCRLLLLQIIVSFAFSYEIYHQIRVSNVTIDDLQLFQSSGIDIDHNTFVPGEYIEFAITDIDIEKLIILGYSYEVLIEDLQHFYEGRLTTNYSREFGLGSMGGYYTLEEAADRLDDIHAEYPEFVSEKMSIGTSYEGRDIWAIKLSDNPSIDEDEPEMLYTGLHHAREPMSFMNLYYFMYWLLENYETDDQARNILENRELWFVPIVNPDGYEYNREIAPNGGGMQRKNRKDTCFNDNNSSDWDGIDLNRNYGYQFHYDDVGSSSDPCGQTYRGVSAFSEPETQVIRDFVFSHDFPIALNYHAYGNLMIYPWGYEPNLPLPEEDYEIFQEIGEEMTLYNNYLLGTGIETVGYTVNGESCDWMYGVEGIYAYTPEIGQNSDGFWPSSNRIVPLAEENLYPNIVAALYVGSLLSSDMIVGEGPYLGSNSYEIDIDFKNIGLSASEGITTLEFYSDDGLEFSNNLIEIGEIDARSEIFLEGITEFFVSPYIPGGTEVNLVLTMTLSNGTQTTSSQSIIIGEQELVFDQGFESGLGDFGWEFSGDSDWYITQENSNSGLSSFRSGEIGDNQQSSVSVSIDFPSIGVAEFSYRVSSEYSTSGDFFYDGLTFFVDGEQQGQFQPTPNGEYPWEYVSLTLPEGNHVFLWTYSKDGGGGSTDCSNTNCDDAGFVDDFSLYAYPSNNPILSGDINFDTSIDILDVVLLVSFVLDTNEPSEQEFIAGDLNVDGEINVLDVVQLVAVILAG